MPRKKKIETDNYYKAFPVAMRKLMNQRNITQNELAVHLGKTRQSISYYCDGSSSPDWETIAKIAAYFCVSTDYLLGLTDDPNPIPSAVDDLGLSPEAVNVLKRDVLYGYVDDEVVFPNAAGHLKDVLNCLLESPDFRKIMAKLSMCFNSFWLCANRQDTSPIDFSYSSEHSAGVLNRLLESPDYLEIMTSLLMCFNSFWINSNGHGIESIDHEHQEELDWAGYAVLKGDEAGRFYAAEAGERLTAFACKEIPKLVESLIEAKRKSATVEATMAEM